MQKRVSSLVILVGLALSMVSASCPPRAIDDPLTDLMDAFEEGYARHTQPLAMAWQDNLPNGQPSRKQLEGHLKYFQQLWTQFEGLQGRPFFSEDHLEISILEYEIILQRDRAQLALATEVVDVDQLASLHEHPQGAEWYAWLVRAWTSTNITPDTVRNLGYHLANHYRQQLDALGIAPHLPLDEAGRQHWYTPDQATKQDSRIARHQRALANLDDWFPTDFDLANLSFSPVAHERMAQVPGYYTNSTLYYNTFHTEYDLRQADWLYVHEAIPGHHYQTQYESGREVPAYRERLSWGGFREGWAAYVEEPEIGQAMGLYQTPQELASMYQWNLIRAVRLVLDVGLNLGELTDAAALAIWRRYLPNMEAIGQREIDRMRRWPAQVNSYLVGAHAMRTLRQQQQPSLDDAFSIKAFHTQLLSQRSIPIQCIPKLFPL